MGDKDQPLAVELHGQTISITIGTSAFAEAYLKGFDPSVIERDEISIPDDYNLACATIMELRRSSGRHVLALAFLVSAAERGRYTGAIRHNPATPASKEA